MPEYMVQIRRDIGMTVKPEAEQLDGKVYGFRFGWVQDDEDRYPGESAMLPNDPNWPEDAPVWISSGDLLEVIDE